MSLTHLLSLFLLLLLTNSSDPDQTVLFEMDLNSSGLAKFKELKSSNTAKSTVDSSTSEPIITFDGLSRYGGMVTKDWIISETNWYHLTVQFRGIQGKRTGAFIGYISQDNNSIIHSIGMDQDQLMDDFQLFTFDNSDSQWKDYEAYFNGGSAIKLVLEKGNYYGLSEDLDAAFKNLEVNAVAFSEECPGDDFEIKGSYFAKLFETSNFAGKINQECKLIQSTNKVALKLQFPSIDIPCIKTQLYGIDQDGSVINDIDQTETKTIENKDVKVTFTYEFTSEQLQKFNCYQSEIECTKNSITSTCIRYQCDFQLHFYVDPSNSYATKQLEYGFTNVNAAGKFKSMFVVQIYKDSKEFFNSMIQVPSLDKPCAGRCKLNQDIKLTSYIKNVQGQWLPQTTFTVVWGDDIDIKYVSTPSNYILSFFDIFVKNSEDEWVSVGYEFIKNFDNSKQGEMIFTIPISTESGLTKGSPHFNFKFLILLSEVTSRRRRVLATTFSSDSLPEAAMSPDDNKFTFGDCTTSTSCVSSSCSSSDICICKDTESCSVFDQCSAANCTCDAVTDMKTRCELIECIQNYGCENCFCFTPKASVNSDGTTSDNSDKNPTGSSSSQTDSSSGSTGSTTTTTEDKFAGRIAVISVLALIGFLLF